VPRDFAQSNSSDNGLDLFRDMLYLGAREAIEIAERFPKVQRRVGGYNLDALVPRNAPNNMAHLLVGSEGTLAFTSQAILLLVLLNRQFAGVLKVGGTLLRVIPASLAAGLLAFGLLQLPLPALPLAALSLLAGGLLVLPFIWPEINLLLRL